VAGGHQHLGGRLEQGRRHLSRLRNLPERKAAAGRVGSVMPPHAPAAGPGSPSRCARTPGADRRLPSLASAAPAPASLRWRSRSPSRPPATCSATCSSTCWPSSRRCWWPSR
jgi:hypothetical protein